MEEKGKEREQLQQEADSVEKQGQREHTARSEVKPENVTNNIDQRPESRPRTVSDSTSVTASTPRDQSSHSQSRARRQDRVSVGSRVNRTVLVRPPYAARDNLDFERRPRSNTVGTPSVSDVDKENQRSGRHPGIQPAAYIKTVAADNSTRSQTESGLEKGGEKDAAYNAPQDSGPADIRKVKPEIDNLNPPAHGDIGQTAARSSEAMSRPGMGLRQPTNDASRWFAFTIPMRYRKRLDEYMAKMREQEAQEDEDGDLARRNTRDESAVDSESDSSNSASSRRYRRKSRRRRASHEPPSSRRHSDNYDEEAGRSKPTRDRPKRSSRRSSRHLEAESSPERRTGEGLAMTMHANLPDPTQSTPNQGQTPGWLSPWGPASRNGGALNRFPSTSTLNGLGITRPKDLKKKRSRLEIFQYWLIRSAFAPLLFRIFNLAFTGCILGVAINIRRISLQYSVIGIMGSSTTFAIVVGPLSLIHIFTNVYVSKAEYFGSPIGVWKVRSKMFYTLTELIFICLWSSLLSLAFDDLFSSPAGCTAYTPNANYKSVAIGSSTVEGSVADKLCDNQVALVSLTFVGLLLYVLVLIVSLFRIFAKITRI